ncbi:enoyl-CoA hydratase/isomerase family protein [Microbacterium sp. GCS4]|uniref:enoyl-CoA hydratase/isomerase family protein n=1 Tax=Microbacterium sp. GCS4 TaxID=1692239 RepID=UPI0006823AF8|nr:enoyl-CoA hydratase/isomerase family protein [Microbacterium sp. GCS4]KNY07606.1 enoyl-CoA hydratase [Microbacterium sp. GCS4]
MGGAQSSPLIVERADGRVIATLDRPAKRNAIDQAMIDALHALCEELEHDPRTLILVGAGGVFAAGADIAELRERRAADALRGINAHAFVRIAELPMPVIAAIDGYALGGGAELAYAADIRIGTPDLVIGNPETGLGILAAAGASWRLKEIVGDARAAELLLTGRSVKAEEALRIGLVSSVHDTADLLPAAHAIADRIARNDRAATIATKRVFRAPRAEHPAVDLDAQAALFESPEKFRRMTEFLERRVGSNDRAGSEKGER